MLHSAQSLGHGVGQRADAVDYLRRVALPPLRVRQSGRDGVRTGGCCCLALLRVGAAMREADGPATLAEVVALRRRRPVPGRRGRASPPPWRAGPRPRERRALLFERERMRRILLDFALDRGTTSRRSCASRFPDLTEHEFARWDAAGLLERMAIDGRKLLLQACAVEPVPPQRRSRARAATGTDAVRRRPDGERRTRITARCASGDRQRQAQRRAAPRARHPVAHRRRRRGARRRNRARVDSVSARDLPGQQEDIRLLGKHAGDST